MLAPRQNTRQADEEASGFSNRVSIRVPLFVELQADYYWRQIDSNSVRRLSESFSPWPPERTTGHFLGPAVRSLDVSACQFVKFKLLLLALAFRGVRCQCGDEFLYAKSNKSVSLGFKDEQAARVALPAYDSRDFLHCQTDRYFVLGSRYWIRALCYGLQSTR